jgi:MYXO-CTERM domain-containing protein
VTHRDTSSGREMSENPLDPVTPRSTFRGEGSGAPCDRNMGTGVLRRLRGLLEKGDFTMLRKGALAAGLMGTCCLAGTASADFVGWYFDSYATDYDGSAYAVIDVYAQFDGTTDTVLNVFNAMISNANGSAFVQNDLAGGTWQVQATAGPGAVADSFVLIGGDLGFSNTTALDPAFSPSNAPVPPAGAGWFNNNPPNLQGRVNASTQRTWVGRFVKAGIDTAETLMWAANIGYNQGTGTPAQFGYDDGQGSGPSFSAAYVPAPGAIALLGLAGLAGRRRRG